MGVREWKLRRRFSSHESWAMEGATKARIGARLRRAGPDSQPPSALSAQAQFDSRLGTGHGSLATDHG